MEILIVVRGKQDMNHLGRRLLKELCQKRSFHTTQVKFIDPKNVEEVRIPVPWGHVAGQWWGKKDIQPIVAVHGWQDNAGSWEPLAKIIPDDYSILAIDLPGHGLSSHIPPFQYYFYTDGISTLMRVQKHFGIEKMNLLGHSGGSAVCFLFAATFPEFTNSYFGVDYTAFGYKDEDKRVQTMGNIIDKKIDLSIREHSVSRNYSWEEARDIWIKATDNSLDKNSAEILMKRGLIKLPNGNYIFSRDHRLKGKDIEIINVDQLRKLAENISCHTAIVKGMHSKLFDMPLKNIPDLMDLMKKDAKSFTYHELDGKHHLHMDIPEQILPLLLDLLKRSA